MGEFDQINKRKKNNVRAEKEKIRIIKRKGEKKTGIIEKKIKRIAIEKEGVIITIEKEARVILSKKSTKIVKAEAIIIIKR